MFDDKVARSLAGQASDQVSMPKAELAALRQTLGRILDYLGLEEETLPAEPAETILRKKAKVK